MGQTCSNCITCKEEIPTDFVTSMKESSNYPKKTVAVKVTRMNKSSIQARSNLKKMGECREVSEEHTKHYPYLGPFKYPGGATYQGQYHQGLRCGLGEEIDLGGNQYLGNWKNDLKHGMGYYYYANGDIYIGELKNGLYNGKGTLISNNETFMYDGEWVNGRREG